MALEKVCLVAKKIGKNAKNSAKSVRNFCNEHPFASIAVPSLIGYGGCILTVTGTLLLFNYAENTSYMDFNKTINSFFEGLIYTGITTSVLGGSTALVTTTNHLVENRRRK